MLKFEEKKTRRQKVNSYPYFLATVRFEGHTVSDIRTYVAGTFKKRRSYHRSVLTGIYLTTITLMVFRKQQDLSSVDKAPANVAVRGDLLGFTGYPKRTKAIPLQARTDPEGSRRLSLPDFKTIGTRRW